jgi:polysaccharide biosynthesis transport protein
LRGVNIYVFSRTLGLAHAGTLPPRPFHAIPVLMVSVPPGSEVFPRPLRLSAGSEGPSPGVAFLRMLRKHVALIVAAATLGVGGSLLYSATAQTMYRAQTTIEIDAAPIHPLGDKGTEVRDMGAVGYWNPTEYYETQYKILVSDRVLGAVVRDLGLAQEFVQKPRKDLTPFEAALAKLRGEVTIEPVKNSHLVTIRVEDASPLHARQLADGVASAYMDENLKAAVSGSADALTWIGGQVDHARRDLTDSENALHEFKRENELPSTSINEASNMLRLEMQEYNSALTGTRTKKEELLARQAELLKVDADHPDALPASELLASSFLQSLRNQYVEAIKERAGLLATGKGENHPLVMEAVKRADETKTALLAEVRNIEGAIERDLHIVTREETGESALFEASRLRAVDLNLKEIEYNRLDRTRLENEKLYSMLLERMKDADLARMMNVNNVRVVDLATDPKKPSRPRTQLNLALGTLLGLLTGIGLAWISEQADTSLKTPDQLEERLGVTFLGLIPELQAGADPRYGRGRKRRRKRELAGGGFSELIVHDHPLSGIAEAARSIRTNLTFMNPDKPYRKILVSSAAPSEGKTTVACCLAIALAQAGQRVCIIDCDLRRPRLHRIFHRQGDGGLTDVLVGESTIDQVAKPTGIPNLWCIPAGPLPPNPADLLQSTRFKHFMQEVGEHFDRVVIDSAPLVAVTDPAVVSTLVDGTIFVVRAFKTTVHLAGQGLRSLRDVDSPVIGAVLNSVDLNRHEYSYYYHYYYYKQQGYRQPEKDNGSDRPEVGDEARPS